MFPAVHGVVSQGKPGGGGGGGGGDAPTVVDVTTAGHGISASHTVALPTGSGGLLVVFAKGGLGAAGFEASWSGPAGWSKVAEANPNSLWPLAVFTRVVDGTEPATLTFTLGATQAAVLTAYRVAGAHGSVEAGTAESFGTPEVTPLWGAADNLWLACIGLRRNDAIFTAAPPDYSGLLAVHSPAASSNTNRAQMATAYRTLNAATHQPGDFTVTGTINGRNWALVAVRPA